MSGKKSETLPLQSEPEVEAVKKPQAPPQSLLDDIARHKYMAAQLERRGQVDTFAHTRLEQLAKELEKYEVIEDGN